MYSVQARKKPPSATQKISQIAMPALNVRARNRLSGTSGDPAVLVRHRS